MKRPYRTGCGVQTAPRWVFPSGRPPSWTGRSPCIHLSQEEEEEVRVMSKECVPNNTHDSTPPKTWHTQQEWVTKNLLMIQIVTNLLRARNDNQLWMAIASFGVHELLNLWTIRVVPIEKKSWEYYLLLSSVPPRGKSPLTFSGSYVSWGEITLLMYLHNFVFTLYKYIVVHYVVH